MSELDDLNKDSSDHVQSNKWQLYKGITMSMLAALCFSLSAVIVKYLKNISVEQLSLYRSIGLFIFNLPLVVKHGENVFDYQELWFPLLLRCIFGCTSLLLEFYAFQCLSLADAYTILQSIPVFASVLAFVFLKEPCGLFQILMILMTMFGLSLTTKLVYMLSMETESLFVDNSTAIIEAMNVEFGHRTDHYYYGVSAALSSALCISLAEMAGPVAVVRVATDIILSFVWQIFIFNNNPDVWTISGAIVVAFAIFLTSCHKWIHSKNNKK
ncbi:unnamed protein product [Medioppia subpectinata]|uniref:EamA domain-containing protein n=1 Tax=Medioppia subpectinata TaxID=1979941 RepID=A0A7R9KGQ9_9ACAR|nr:unnamed protein product [Medioppia subpectinata]CAG2103095.1 unnamed protein product [Medioppia subpectinata]